MIFPSELILPIFVVIVFCSFMSFSIFSLYSFAKEGAFSMKPIVRPKKLTWSALFAILFLYFSSFCFISLFFFLIGGEKSLLGLPQLHYFLLTSTLSSLLALVVLGMYIFTFSRDQKEELFGKVGLEPIKKGIRWAASFFFIPYFLVFVIHLILFMTKHIEPEEQSAFNMIRVSSSSWPILLMTFISITIISPILEELIFRGFLQNLFGQTFHPFGSISITSIIFALAHYDSELGCSNIAIIISLMSLSYFLGMLYEKEKSLLAPISMHITFNTISVLLFGLYNAL
jgi:uncharacterized protein